MILRDINRCLNIGIIREKEFIVIQYFIILNFISKLNVEINKRRKRFLNRIEFIINRDIDSIFYFLEIRMITRLNSEKERNRDIPYFL